MVAANLKAETLSLMDKRKALEDEMNAIIERLTQPGGPGLSGKLLDFRGFPREDIDIPAVRAERRRLAELKNDHKDLTEKLDRNLQVLHSAKFAPVASSLKQSDGESGGLVDVGESAALTSVASNAMDVDVSVPFALVDEIADASPAAEDGLQLGDQIVKFGSVENGDSLLQKLASEAQTNQGSAVPVMVLRQGARVSLMVTPRTWQGRGLLGCHFRIL